MRLSCLGQSLDIRCGDEHIRQLLAANFEALLAPAAEGEASGTYEIGGTPAGFEVRTGDRTETCADEGDLVFTVEKSLTILLQLRRPDLLFLHAAALETGGRAHLLLADSGGGKSTLAWTLLHQGLGYLSDELAPVDLARMEVHPYPHALCLKWAPPAPFGLPASTVKARRTWHVPTAALPSTVIRGPRPLGSLVFLGPRDAAGPRIAPITPAEAATRLYTSSLNALAHPGDGLDAAVRLASGAPSYLLSAADPEGTALLVRATLAA